VKRQKKLTKARVVKATLSDLRLVSENQRMDGFSGRISQTDKDHETNMETVSHSAEQLGAQIPIPGSQMPPRIKRFGKSQFPRKRSGRRSGR
jgi:hypothetical protein